LNPDKDLRWKQRFQNFQKAFHQLSIAVDQYPKLNDMEKEGMVQRFECTFELAWKTLKDYLESQEVEAKFPRDVIKRAFQYEIIQEGEIWMDMLERRNEMSHTYNETFFQNVVELIAGPYYQAIQQVINKLKSLS
jgi:nucleotidyltransferase substrate binding protein (TIGR01987 family)